MKKAVALGAIIAGGLLSTPAMASTHTYLNDCAGHGQQAPSTYILACGDGTEWVSHLHWSHWGSRAARATGDFEFVSCTPSCATGHRVARRARVQADVLAGGKYLAIHVREGGKLHSWSVDRQGPAEVS